MRTAFVAVAVLLAACGGGATPTVASLAPRSARPSAPTCKGSPPSWTADVKPVLERRCFKCHAGDGQAAEEHDFSTRETLRIERDALVEDVQNGDMPPKGEPRPPAPEMDTLVQWVACGMVP
jgi:cytochrome c5